MDLDTLIRLLADRQRRAVLRHLLDQTPSNNADGHRGRPVHSTVRTLVAERDAVDEVALRHAHLPQLAENEVIEWDQATDEIRPGPAFDTVAKGLRAIDAGLPTLADE